MKNNLFAMKLPFQCVLACGEVLFAARGSDLHTFNVSSGSYISSWRHPIRNKADTESKSTENGSEVAVSTAASLQGSPEQDQGPPAKRAKLGDTPETEQPQNQEKGSKNGEAKGNGKKSNRRVVPVSGSAENPLIHILTATSDGRHIVAISGQDKTLWVFEHDLAGQIKQLSQRQMPKRPCSVVITPDNKTILSADKFGDVYSLPLIPSEASAPETPASRGSSTPAPSKAFQPSASHLTVHTERNLRALEMQKKQFEAKKMTAKSESASFEHTLLLGHVSLLTDITLAILGGKQYVLTADRDEHIRVSRGIPQTHVIEAYCLGHEEFISKLCIPAGLSELLVSGGGDPDLFLWNWRVGKLLSKTPLLEHAKKVRGCEDLEKVAVSGLYSTSNPDKDEQAKSSIFAICERVPAVFRFQLTGEGSLQYTSTYELPGNPLSVQIRETFTVDSLIVAVDQPQASLLQVDLQKGSEVHAGHFQEDKAESDDVALSMDELTKLLFTTESLRKMDLEDGADTEA